VGRKNNRTLLLGEQLEKIVPDVELLQLMWDTARGMEREALDKNGELVVVRDRPDSKIQAYLADRKWGRMPQPVALSGGLDLTGDLSFECTFRDGRKAAPGGLASTVPVPGGNLPRPA
jgi:hypothetical protein